MRESPDRAYRTATTAAATITVTTANIRLRGIRLIGRIIPLGCVPGDYYMFLYHRTVRFRDRDTPEKTPALSTETLREHTIQ
ncbi:hypothetical protein GCM10029978_055820 [Actinoallomurus acanthiterrae]